jgi:REP element-mobilizing transposase RayT
MTDEEHFHRRHLPHIYLPNAVYFVTFRLAGSLPVHALEDLKEKARLQKKARFSFVDYDKALETSLQNVRWLADVDIADMLSNAIHYQDGKDYVLVAYCIMPNHVHLVIGVGECELLENVRQVSNLSNKTVSQILHSVKRYTARKANTILHRSGAFWQDESYDHVISDGAELERIVQYVIHNPAKAGLVRNWRDWKWTYTVFDLG